jgi:uncharacterized protein DUF2877
VSQSRGGLVRVSTQLAVRLEAPGGRPGRVHSVFARAVNLVWDDGRLWALHGPGPLLAPFAAAVDDVALLGALRPGMPVIVEPLRLRAPGLALSWELAARIDCAVSADPRIPTAVLRPPAPPQSHAPGLDSTAGVGARAALAAGIRGRDASRLIAGACALLGLGEGLTPAGDDCLVGALAVLHAVDPVPLMREPAVAGAIAEAAAARTTAIGREFVLHALAGRFSEPVLAVLRARSRAESARAAAHLAALGATSGADTLGGMRLAWDALAA